MTSERAELEQLRREAWAARAEAFLRDVPPAAPAADQPTTFQVLYETTDRLIIGVGPFDPGSDPGAGFAIATLNLDQQPAVLDSDTSYVCADGQTVQAQPC